jgi:hypothetical protein
VKSRQSAFPGAEGFGAYAKDGSGGEAYTVSTLDFSGPVSFRGDLSGTE